MAKHKNDTLARLNQAQKAKRVTLAEWRAKRMHEMDLPSGLTVKLRDVDMSDLVLTGGIPNTLLDLFGNVDPTKTSEQEIGQKMLGENGQDFAVFLNGIVKATLVEPAIGDSPDDTHIMLDELSFADKIEILNWVNREAGAMRPFREGTEEPAEASQPG